MIKSRLRGSRNLAIALFGSVFLVIGLGFLLFLTLPMVFDAHRMKAWVATSGELLALELHRHQSSDGTTYRVSARYRYQVDGEDWQGERVGLGIGSDNIGDYRQRLFQRLDAERPQVTLWYDPANPGNAILDRSLRLEMLAFNGMFILTFGGLGLALMIHGLRRPVGAIPYAVESAGQVQPFFQRNSDPAIHSGGVGTPLTLWLLAAGGTLFFLPGAWHFRAGLAAGEGMAWLMWALVLLTLGFAIAATLTTLEYRRYGRLALTMDPFPGAIGGDFGATVQLRERFDRRTLFPVNLSCVHVYTQGSGRNRRQQRTMVWHQEGFARILDSGQGTLLAIRFRVPSGLPPSRAESADYHVWYLNLEAVVPGIDLNRQFTVPMLPGLATSRMLATASYADRSAPLSAVPNSLPRIASSPQGTQFYYRMGRHWLGALITGSIAAGFAAGVVFVLPEHASGWWVSSIFVLIFGVLALVLGLFAAYLPFNSLQVTAGSSGAVVERRWFGVLLRRTRVERAAIDHIEAVREMEIQGRKPVIYYRLVAHTREGRQVVVGESLRGSRLADRVTDMLHAALGLKPFHA